MALRINDDIFACESGGQAILLDLQRDRFFLASKRLRDELRQMLEGKSAEDDPTSLNALAPSRMPPGSCGLRISTVPIVAPSTDIFTDRAESSPALLIDAIREQVVMAHALKTRPLWRVVDRIRARKTHPPQHAKDRHSLERRAAAFLGSAKLFGSDQKCLRRSLALANSAAKYGHDVTLYLGVSVRPFSAHCWVQHGDIVLNDSIDEVLQFTPILAI